jgi:hydrogenase nickel incorporation protein HypA/HybF
MHEWALAEATVTAVLETAEKEGLQEIVEVQIKIGELQQIDREIFDFALSQLRPPLMETTKFQIETVPAELQCRVCTYQWSFASEPLDLEVSEAIHFVPEVAHTYLKCPNCGSPDFEILKGRGVWLASIKGGK